MNFTLIICTYMRPIPLLSLLNSVKSQTIYPNEILIIDGSTNNETEAILENNKFQNLQYFKVPNEHRGLTKQRNYGIARVGDVTDVICFLDDDTILEPTYFEEILNAFHSDNEIVGVAGVAINEIRWIKKEPNKKYGKYQFYDFEGYVYPEGARNVLRNILGLQSDLGPGRMPEFSNGRTCGFPLNEKKYEVDLLIGMSFSFRKVVFDNIKFSHYFEGYGLYEDADFSIRVQKFGKNVITTKAKLLHYHDPSGRPNQYEYGKMVVRNGWYVWRVKNPKPLLNTKMKWHAITILLIIIRYTNALTTNKKRQAFTEAFGRSIGWISLFYNKPK